MDNNRLYVSCRGNGVEGWRWFIKGRTPYETLPYPVLYNDNFATGTVLDVTEGLFSNEAAEVITPFLNNKGAYPTGACEDYNGNWMLRRSLWTDEDGTEHVAEGTVSSEGLIIDPITIHTYHYAANTIYPLKGSWEEVLEIASKGTWDKVSKYVHDEAGYVNLVVPLSFFDYAKFVYKMDSFCDLSSRTFYTGLSRMDDGNILLECVFDTIYIPWDIDDGEDYNVFFKGIVSPEGVIIEPLHIDAPKDKYLMSDYEERYADYYKGIDFMPQPWNKHCKWKDLNDWKNRNQKRLDKRKKK